jgi:hypothetical protein
MKRHLTCAALAAMLVSPVAPMLTRSGAALASTAADLTGSTTVAIGATGATGFTVPAMEAPTLVTNADGESGTSLDSRYLASSRFESSRYRPRRDRGNDYYRDGGYSHSRGVTQLHAGFLDPDGPATSGFLIGFRGGQQIDDVLQIGLGIDWRNKSGRSTDVLRSSTGPGGETIVSRRDISRYSSNLFPGIAYVQVSAPSSMGVVPYFGAAASWQVLFLNADDFQTGQSFDATYDGFGWQLWGGAGVPLSGRSKLVGEVFLNNADLGRDVFDPISGQNIRETVSTNGVGARFGINWGF